MQLHLDLKVHMCTQQSDSSFSALIHAILRDLVSFTSLKIERGQRCDGPAHPAAPFCRRSASASLTPTQPRSLSASHPRITRTRDEAGWPIFLRRADRQLRHTQGNPWVWSIFPSAREREVKYLQYSHLIIPRYTTEVSAIRGGQNLSDISVAEDANYNIADQIGKVQINAVLSRNFIPPPA